MRNVLNVNEKWLFIKGSDDIKGHDGEWIDLPHTWNAVDGQDGGNDYFRGSSVYRKVMPRSAFPRGEIYYLEFRGTNSSASLFVNGKKMGEHDGGYSTWRVDITNALDETNEIAVVVDNGVRDDIYPQMADFTFYGGIYRDVNLIGVSRTHFDLDYYGGDGIKITPIVDGADATVEIEVFLTNLEVGQEISYTVFDEKKNLVYEKTCSSKKIKFSIENAKLWHGREHPHLYLCEVKLKEGDEVLDTVSAHFGCRSFEIDPEKGFILNGKPYPLRGVSRHQDRWGIGNALLPHHHEEDMDLICEMGANTVRLAHYQHDGYFYDLCDKRGLVVWAEIPYISKHLERGTENALSQMRELIVQNYNHPSIAVWGLSNEITIGGSHEALLKDHKRLNDLCHEMDPTRRTVVAAVSMCPMDDEYLKIPDAVSYNHYFGWYGGETEMNGPWFDRFHKKHPAIPIGCSEYGCEALNWHTSHPMQGDYTEEYQALYHEELIRQFFQRDYLWATHVWNMFDFGADARNEGGENGQNHKGLVTFDRKYKKDAFYAYKAWLSNEPFVHLCSKRYVDRVEDVTVVKVYSNQPEVELFVNGKSVGKKSVPDHFFTFEVENKGESHLVARAGSLSDEGKIRKVDSPNPDYVLVEKGAVLNWFDVSAPEGKFSLNDKISHIMESQKGKLWLIKTALQLKKKAEKSSEKEKGKSGGFEFDLKGNQNLLDMMGGFTLLRLTSLMGMMNVHFTKEELLSMNAELNQIRKPKEKNEA